MALTSISGLGIGSGTDEEVLACLLAGGTREQCGMPSYCFATSIDPRSWYRGLLPQCAPYTQEELDAMTRSQATEACKFAADWVACEADLVAKAAAVQAVAESTDTEGTCEYKASQEHPGLSRLLSPMVVCDLYAGRYTPYIVAGAIVIGLLLMSRRRMY